MFAIIINIIGIIFCIALFFKAVNSETPVGAIIAVFLLCLNCYLLTLNIEKKNSPDKFNVTIIETKTPPTIDTLIRRGTFSDTTYVITAIDAKTR